MEPWLRNQLLTKTGGFRAARFTRCKTCGHWTLHGPDDDRAAIQTTVDPTPIDPEQEYACVVFQGRRTYTLGRTPTGKPQIETRDPLAIATPCTRTVVPAHKCGATRFTSTPPPATRQDTDTCPF